MVLKWSDTDKSKLRGRKARFDLHFRSMFLRPNHHHTKGADPHQNRPPRTSAVLKARILARRGPENRVLWVSGRTEKADDTSRPGSQGGLARDLARIQPNRMARAWLNGSSQKVRRWWWQEGWFRGRMTWLNQALLEETTSSMQWTPFGRLSGAAR